MLWLIISGTITVLAGMAEFSGYSLRDLFDKEKHEKKDQYDKMDNDTTKIIQNKPTCVNAQPQQMLYLS